jgi:hypothetical protein
MKYDWDTNLATSECTYKVLEFMYHQEGSSRSKAEDTAKEEKEESIRQLRYS